MEYLQFLLISFFSYVFIPLTFALSLYSFRRFIPLPFMAILLVSMILSPFLISIFLYYLLLLIPHQNPLFYVFMPFILVLFLFWMFRKNIPLFIGELNQRVRKSKIKSDWRYMAFMNYAALVVISFFLLIFFNRMFTVSILGHDMLEYALMARIISNQQAITYVSDIFDPSSGFYYVALHGLAFPLMGVWENLWNRISGLNSDLFFRSLNLYFGIQIFLLLYYSLRKINPFLGSIALLLLVFTKGFFYALNDYHIDTCRIAVFCCSLFLLIYTIQQQNFYLAAIFAVACGFHGFTHSLGVFLSFLEIAVLFFSLRFNIRKRLVWVLGVLGIFLIMGGIHYFFDSLWGTHWIFKDIKFY